MVGCGWAPKIVIDFDVICVRLHATRRYTTEQKQVNAVQEKLDTLAKELKTMSAIQQALKTHFGFDKFRSKQQEDVVKAVVRGKCAVRD